MTVLYAIQLIKKSLLEYLIPPPPSFPPCLLSFSRSLISQRGRVTVVFNPLSRPSRKTFAASFPSDFSLGVVCLCACRHASVCVFDRNIGLGLGMVMGFACWLWLWWRWWWGDWGRQLGGGGESWSLGRDSKIQHGEELLLSTRQKRKQRDKKLQQLGQNQACKKSCFEGASVVNSPRIQSKPSLLVCHLGALEVFFFPSFFFSHPLLLSPSLFFPEVCSPDRGIVWTPLYRKLISAGCLLGVIGW